MVRYNIELLEIRCMEMVFAIHVVDASVDLYRFLLVRSGQSRYLESACRQGCC